MFKPGDFQKSFNYFNYSNYSDICAFQNKFVCCSSVDKCFRVLEKEHFFSQWLGHRRSGRSWFCFVLVVGVFSLVAFFVVYVLFAFCFGLGFCFCGFFCFLLGFMGSQSLLSSGFWLPGPRACYVKVFICPEPLCNREWRAARLYSPVSLYSVNKPSAAPFNQPFLWGAQRWISHH